MSRKSFKDRLRVFNKHVTNRILGRLAGAPFGPFALIQHVGRRSGTSYTTPVLVVPEPDAFVVALTYGPQVDWYRNVQAAGECGMVWHGQTYLIDGVTTLPTAAGRAVFPPLERAVLTRLGVRDFIRLHRAAVTKV